MHWVMAFNMTLARQSWLLRACGERGGERLARLGRFGRLGVPGMTRLPMFAKPASMLPGIFEKAGSAAVPIGVDMDLLWPAQQHMICHT